ncbi:MAG: tetratricopeptide repeat protein [Balneolales bacterium]|nr:tetratricopeptide repeat protein [Balneolales bacterium]
MAKQVLLSLVILGLVYACTGNTSTNSPFTSEISDSELTNQFFDYSLAQEYIQSANYDTARALALNSIQFLEPYGNTLELGNNYMIVADSYFYQSDYKEAMEYALKARSVAQFVSSDSLLGFAQKRIARVNTRLGNYQLAAEQMYKAIEIGETLEDKTLLGMAYQDLGNVFDYDAEYEAAEEFYLKAIEVFEEIGNEIQVAGLIGNLGSMAYEDEDYKRALELHRESLKTLLANNHKRWLANTYNNISVTYRELGEYDSTLFYIRKTLQLDIEAGYKMGIAQDYEMMGEIYLRRNQNELAKEHFLMGYGIAKDIGVLDRQKTMSLRLFKADSALGNHKEAGEWLNNAYDIRDSVYNQEQAWALAEMRELYEAEQRDREIAFLNQEAELKTTRNSLIGFSLVLIIGIMGLVWSRQRVTQRQELQLLEKDKIIAEQELESKETETEYLKKELTNYALHIAQKNEFLNQIKTEMADLRSKVSNNDAVKHINQVGSKIYRNTTINQELEDFQTHVDQVCEGFFQRLTHKFPNLSNQEKRLAALVRLNLSSKDIASIFNISPKSVDQGRYRLRKKLDLDSNENLSNYLNVV